MRTINLESVAQPACWTTQGTAGCCSGIEVLDTCSSSHRVARVVPVSAPWSLSTRPLLRLLARGAHGVSRLGRLPLPVREPPLARNRRVSHGSKTASSKSTEKVTSFRRCGLLSGFQKKKKHHCSNRTPTDLINTCTCFGAWFVSVNFFNSRGTCTSPKKKEPEHCQNGSPPK